MNHVLAAQPLAVYLAFDLSFKVLLQTILSAAMAFVTIAIARNAIPAVWKQEYMALVPLGIAAILAVSLMTEFQLYVDLWNGLAHLVDPTAGGVSPVPVPSVTP